jgi:hypothetical protein
MNICHSKRYSTTKSGRVTTCHCKIRIMFRELYIPAAGKTSRKQSFIDSGNRILKVWRNNYSMSQNFVYNYSEINEKQS